MKRYRGFTLIELMIAMAIVAAMSGAILMMVKMSYQTWQVSDAYMATSAELRRGVDEMAKWLASTGAAKMTIDGSGDSLTFAVPYDIDGDPNGSVLNEATGSLEWSDDAGGPGTITFFLDDADANGNGLTDEVIGSYPGELLHPGDEAFEGVVVDRVLANGVTNVDFSLPSINTVELTLTVERGTTSGDFPNQASMTTRVRLRND